MTDLQERLLKEFPEICEQALGAYGVPKSDIVQIYNRGIRLFGNPEIAGQLEEKFLSPLAMQCLAKELNIDLMSEGSLRLLVTKHMKELLQKSLDHWVWLLNEELITMDRLINERDTWDLEADSEAHNLALKWFLKDLPVSKSSERFSYYYFAEPSEGSRIVLDNVQLTVRAWGIKISSLVDPRPIPLIDQAVIPAGEQIELSVPIGLPRHNATVLRTLCMIRFCMYLVYSIGAADKELNGNGELGLV